MNLSPGSQYDQRQLFVPEEEHDVHKKKSPKKRKGRSRSQHREMSEMRRSDPRGIVKNWTH
jgi:hypothetical protein